MLKSEKCYVMFFIVYPSDEGMSYVEKRSINTKLYCCVDTDSYN